jgi:hypothetical protein
MSSYFDPKSPPPPPAQSATFKQIVVMLLFASLGSMFVINAIRSQQGNSLFVGVVLIFFALVFFAGLISRNQVVELVASGILLLGAGGLVALTVISRDVLWGAGAVFFVLCVAVIQLKHRFIDQAAPPDSGLRNPYT